MNQNLTNILIDDLFTISSSEEARDWLNLFLDYSNFSCCLLNLQSSSQNCLDCKKISDIQPGKRSSVSKIQCRGKFYILKTILNVEIFCNFNDMTDEILDYKYAIGLDEFTLESMIEYTLPFLLKTINTFVKINTSIFCSSEQSGKENEAGIVTEYANLGNLFDFSMDEYTKTYSHERLLLDIIIQTIGSLSLLEKWSFSHGDLKLKNIFLASTRFSATILGLKCRSPITIKMGDFGAASLTVNDVRIFNNSWEYPFMTESECREYFYFNPQPVELIYLKSRNSLYPFYSSFDTYCFMISLMLHPVYHDMILNNIYLRQLWTNLWFEDDYEFITQEVAILRFDPEKNATISTAISLLITPLLRFKYLKLRCNANSLLWNVIKKINNRV